MDITNFKEINKGCLLAKFDVIVPEWGMTIRELTLFEKEGKRWVGLPGRAYESDGKKKSYDHIVFDKDRRQRFEASCLEKISSMQHQTKQEKQFEDVPF